jgi:hypothetical protein
MSKKIPSSLRKTQGIRPYPGSSCGLKGLDSIEQKQVRPTISARSNAFGNSWGRFPALSRERHSEIFAPVLPGCRCGFARLRVNAILTPEQPASWQIAAPENDARWNTMPSIGYDRVDFF